MQQRRSIFSSTFLVALLLAVALPAILHTYAGVSVRTIRTGSMAPAMQPGDLALVRAVSAKAIIPGDIALLFHPADGQVEAHRVTSIKRTDVGFEVITKGDANPSVDPSLMIPATAAVERVALVVPRSGQLLASFGSPLVLASLCALGLLVLVVLEMQDRRRRSVASEETPETVRSA